METRQPTNRAQREVRVNVGSQSRISVDSKAQWVAWTSIADPTPPGQRDRDSHPAIHDGTGQYTRSFDHVFAAVGADAIRDLSERSSGSGRRRQVAMVSASSTIRADSSVMQAHAQECFGRQLRNAVCSVVVRASSCSTSAAGIGLAKRYP